MERIRTGVIGLGRMGKHHCRVYASQRESQLAAIHDTNPRVAAELSQLYDVPAYEQIDEFLQNVDAVSIATPTPTHFDLVRRCIEQHVHVLVEKPITDSIDSANELVSMIDGSGLVVQVGHIERFNPTYIELKNVLENQKVLAINFRRLSPYRVSNKDADVVLDLMVHDLDLCVDLIGSEPLAVSAYGLAPFSNSLDYVVAQLMYLNGPLITLTASRVTEEKIRSVEVTTQEAYIEADFLNKNIFTHRYTTGEYSVQNHNSVKYQQESLIQRILVPNVEPLALEIKHFLKCVAQNQISNISTAAGWHALRLAEYIRKQVNDVNLELRTQSELSSTTKVN